MINQPSFIMFIGPMWGSKTTKMLAHAERYELADKKVLYVKPSRDERYGKKTINTHRGHKVKCENIIFANDIAKLVDESNLPDVIAVDEAFMVPKIASILIEYFRKGVTILVSSLDLSAQLTKFDEISIMCSWATKIEKCPAVCTECGNDAYYTHKIGNGNKIIEIGAEDKYEPRCWFHHPLM